MTYDAREKSADAGSPVEVYTFNRGAMAWRFTSAIADRVVDFQLYKRAPIRRSDIEQGSEINRSGLKLTVPRDFAVAQLYMVAPPSDVVSLTLRQYHEGDGEVATIWSGRILSVKFSGSQAEINLEPIGTSIRRNGLRRPYQKPCPRVLGSKGCSVNLEGYKVTGGVDSILGAVVSVGEVASFADGYFDGGYIEWPQGSGVFERRFIAEHAGAALSLDIPPLGLTNGAAVTVYPGCDHTTGPGGCARFSNILNFGGMPYIPTKNPFGSDPVY